MSLRASLIEEYSLNDNWNQQRHAAYAHHSLLAEFDKTLQVLLELSPDSFFLSQIVRLLFQTGYLGSGEAQSPVDLIHRNVRIRLLQDKP